MPSKQEILEGEIDEPVFECWVSGTPEDSFVKLNETEFVESWAGNWIGKLETGQHIHIVAHLTSEYSNGS